MRQARIIRRRLFSVVGEEKLFKSTAVRHQAPPGDRLLFPFEQPYPRLHPGTAGDFVPFFYQAGAHADRRPVEDEGQFHRS